MPKMRKINPKCPLCQKDIPLEYYQREKIRACAGSRADNVMPIFATEQIDLTFRCYTCNTEMIVPVRTIDYILFINKDDVHLQEYKGR